MAESENGQYQCFLLEEGEIDAAITVISLDREDFDDLSPERQQDVWNAAHYTLSGDAYEMFALVDTHNDRLVGKGMIDFKIEDIPEITGSFVLPEERGQRLVDILYQARMLSLREQGYEEVMGRISLDNHASFKAATRNGFEVFDRDLGVEPPPNEPRFVKRALNPIVPANVTRVQFGPDSAADGLDHVAV
jgi:RimJ/RimL family protein N-acetyltransferase